MGGARAASAGGRSAENRGAEGPGNYEGRTQDGLKFRDLNKNGSLDPYEDWRLPVEQRVADLVSRMTLEEKTGLMIHSSLSGFTGPNGEVLGLPAAGGRGGPGRGAPSASSAHRALQGRAN